MKAIHPHFNMPPPQDKAPLLKLLPQDLLDAAEKHDQSTFFARQGRSQQQQLRKTIGPGISKSARRAAAGRAAQARAGGSKSDAATQAAGQPSAVRQTVTPRHANKDKDKNKGNSVGGPKSGAPKGQ